MSRITRRGVLAGASLAAAAPIVEAQKLAGEAPGRIPPVQDLVNTSEFEAIAQRKLDPLTFAQIASGERAALDRITLRPRLMIDTTKMDLGATLFGQALFTPILIGPVSMQGRFHPDAELAMARGAAAAKAVLVVADRTSVPISQIAAEAKGGFWHQVYLDQDVDAARGRAQQAVSAGCKALCVTVGAASDPAAAPKTAGIDWAAIGKLRQGLSLPVVLKGVMSPEDAQKAIAEGVQGIVVSNYSGRAMTGIASPIEVLPAIADAVSGRVPILIDGGIRLGSDVFKAIALGAQAVLLARPAIWGLAAYGAPGVQKAVELIQSEFARDMAMCGKVNLKALDRTAVKIHRR